MTKVTVRIDLLAMLDELSPRMSAAFLTAISDITNTVVLNSITEALAVGNIELAIRNLNLSEAMFNGMAIEMRNAYERAGSEFMKKVPAVRDPTGTVIAARFEGRNPRAEMLIRQKSSRLIKEITDGQRELVRTFLTGAMERGVNPRTAALDLVGRVDRATGLRTGGRIGLTSYQSGISDNALAELTSGSPAEMDSYLQRKLRDRRFDPVVRKALREGGSVPSATAKKIAGRYRDSLLRNRGETIARTEMLSALHAGQDEGINQVVDSGAISAENVTRRWDAQEDKATRRSHAAAEGQKRKPKEPFVLGSGATLMYPGDRSLGAPGGEVINCRCRVVADMDFINDLAMRFRR